MSSSHGVLLGEAVRAWRRLAGGSIVLWMAAAPGAVPAGIDSPAAMPHPLSPEYALILTGGELLDGSVRDSHTPFLARTLHGLGMRCVQTLLVDDSPADLKGALETATSRASLVLVTGGLGPTANDITREVVSDFTGIALVEDPGLVGELGKRFGQAPQSLRANLRRQVQVPVSGSYLPNDHGTAVGLVFPAGGRTVIALPGPPRELQPMVTDHLVPWLRERLGLPARGVSLSLRFVGLGQSAIASALEESGALPPGVFTASRFEGSRVDFTFSFPVDSPATREGLRTLATTALERLGDHLYATNASTLEQIVWSGLEAQGTSLVVVETPGPFLASAFAQAELPPAAAITSISASDVPSLIPALGLGDDALARSPDKPADEAVFLGRAARSRTGATWVLVLVAPGGLGREAPAQGWVALGHPDGSWDTWSQPRSGSPETGWAGAVTAVLDRVRRAVAQPNTKRITTPSTIR